MTDTSNESDDELEGLLRYESVGVLSFNIQKNSLYTSVLLESLKDSNYDILFLQEPPWGIVRKAPSSSSKDGDPVIGAPTHPDWLQVVRPPSGGEHPRVLAYVHNRLKGFRPPGSYRSPRHLDCLTLCWG